MISQLRGTLYLQKILEDGSLAKAIAICTDTLEFGLSVEKWSHINKCGPQDVEDASGVKSQAATLTMSLAQMEDKIFALGVLGTIVEDGDSGNVTDEELPQDLGDGDIWFLGGKTRHRNITALTIDGMTVDVDFTLDAETGKVTFIGDQATGSPGPVAAYTYDDPQYVSMLTSSSDYYFASYEAIDKQNGNAKLSYEFYKIRFDPADNVSLQSDENQSMTFNGSALADTDRPVDGELGQFGRRVL